jgi:diacylglycerol kinase
MALNSKYKPKDWVGKLAVGVNGIKTAFRTEPTLSIQVIVGLAATIMAIVVGGQWWYVKQTIFLTVAVVLAELINTAIEYLCDLVEPNKNMKIKKIKDILAGVVLIVAVMSIIITLIDLVNILIAYYK